MKIWLPPYISVRRTGGGLRLGTMPPLAEKLLPDSSMLSRFYIDLYHDYKERSGYSRSEIARKREALENVLVPYRDSENRAMLHEAGFNRWTMPSAGTTSRST